jgi:hypothetical protein
MRLCWTLALAVLPQGFGTTQLQFAALGKEHVPGFTIETYGIVHVGDVDGDRSLDLLALPLTAAGVFYRNDGSGTFQKVSGRTLPFSAFQALFVDPTGPSRRFSNPILDRVRF